MTSAAETDCAIIAVTQAAALCRAVRAELVNLEALEKEDRSPVTVADYGAQALICRVLRAAFPADPIVGEEDAADLRRPENAPILARVTEHVRRVTGDVSPEAVCRWIDAGNGRVSRRFWTVDPIDGTKGFLRDEQYAIALALIEDGQVKVAVLGCPALPLDMERPHDGCGALFVAVRGAGATMTGLDGGDPAPIAVAQPGDPARFRFVESVETAHGNPTLQQAVARAAGVDRPPLRIDSQAKYAAVARGDAALYLRFPSTRRSDYREKIWDHAAGALIVQEAGGRVTDMAGRPLDLASGVRMQNNRGVIASNGAVHAAALEALADHEESTL